MYLKQKHIGKQVNLPGNEIWCELLEVHEECKISQIVIQSPNSNYPLVIRNSNNWLIK